MSGYTSAGIAVAGLAMNVYGQVQQQGAQAQAASAGQAQAIYQAQVARQNQELARRQAADAIQRGQVAEEGRRRLTQQQIGTQTAGLAAQGTDLEGSPIDILSDTAAAGEFDARTIRANAAREAYGYTVQGLGYGNEAILQSTRAANSQYSPNYLGAGASLLSGASSLGAKWKIFQDSRPPATAATDYGIGTGTGAIY